MLIGWCADLLRCVDRPASTWRAVNREMDGCQVHSGTLSETIARTLRTETHAGQVAWTVVIAGASAAMWWHILRFQYSTKAQP